MRYTRNIQSSCASGACDHEDGPGHDHDHDHEDGPGACDHDHEAVERFLFEGDGWRVDDDMELRPEKEYSGDRSRQMQKLFDIKSSPACIIMLQEAEASLIDHLKTDKNPGVPEGNDGDGDGNLHGGGETWLKRPESEFIGFRGPETNSSSLLICGRTSLVKGMRMLLFRLRPDGTYKKKSKGKRAKHEPRIANTRIMVVACRMRFFRIHGGGGGDHGGGGEDDDTLVLVNSHLH